MGIKGLTALLAEHAPNAIKVLSWPIPLSAQRKIISRPLGQEHEIKTLFGRKVAIDASMSIYQFLIAVRQKDGELLTNEAGETTRYSIESSMKPPY
jgi:flap endonuclease-1